MKPDLLTYLLEQNVVLKDKDCWLLDQVDDFIVYPTSYNPEEIRFIFTDYNKSVVREVRIYKLTNTDYEINLEKENIVSVCDFVEYEDWRKLVSFLSNVNAENVFVDKKLFYMQDSSFCLSVDVKSNELKLYVDYSPCVRPLDIVVKLKEFTLENIREQLLHQKHYLSKISDKNAKTITLTQIIKLFKTIKECHANN